MFFVKAGSLLAWILVVFGALKTAMGFFVTFTFESHESMVAASKRYLASANSGEAINEGMLLFATGVVIGLLVKIAKSRDSY